MDAGTLIYIALVILYFLFTAFKKKDKPVEDERFEGEEQGQQRPASFEDMLREIRRDQEDRIKDVEESGQGDVLEKPKSYQDTFYEERTEARPKPKPKPAPKAQKPHKKYYEGGEGSLKSYEKTPLKTLDEQVDIYSDEKILGEVEDVAEEKVGSNRFAELLKNSDTVKDAVVLSEILNRRHF
jgi:hypothetical protein